MAANINPIFPIAPVSAVASFVNADSITPKSLYTPTLLNGARVDGILLSNNDTIAHDVQLFLRRSSVSYSLGVVTVPINAGFDAAVPPVNMLAAIAALSPGSLVFMLDPYGNLVLPLDSASALWWAPLVVVTAAKVLNGIVLAGEY